MCMIFEITHSKSDRNEFSLGSLENRRVKDYPNIYQNNLFGRVFATTSVFLECMGFGSRNSF